jgi:hypothetical protein
MARQSKIKKRERARILLTLLLGIFLISFTSGADWDNGIRYENDDMKAIIENVWGLPLIGSDLGSVELKSHKSINEVLPIAPGENKIVMYYDFNFTELYENGLGEVEFINMTSGKNIEKDYNFVIWDRIYEEKNNYSKKCNVQLNGTKVCNNVLTGTYIEETYGWIKLDNINIPKGKVRIGLATDVNIGDKIDGIWTIAGQKIEKHAVWTASLNVGLISFWKLNQTSGDVLDSLGINNGTNNGAVRGVPGIINNSFDFEAGGSTWVTVSHDDSLNITDAITINAWVNPESTPTTEAPRILDKGDNAGNYVFYYSSNGTIFGTNNVLSNASGNGTVSNDNWHMLSVTYNETLLAFYVDGVSVKNDTTYTTAFATDALALTIGERLSHDRPWDGELDEIGLWNRTLTPSEISQLWNGGAAITYTDIFIPTVTLNYPPNGSSINQSLIKFNCSAEILSGETLTNISLYTNESGTWEAKNITTGLSGNSTIQTWNRTLADGNYIYSCEACASNNECSFALNNNTFTIDFSFPTISVENPTGILDYNIIGSNETLNVTFTDLSLDTCWFDYNGTNITIEGCLSNIKNSTNFILEDDNFNMTIYANDSTGNINSTFITWDYIIIEINQTYNNETLEGAAEEFSATIELGQGETITAVALVYNGSASAGTTSTIGDNTELNTDLIIPQVTTETNITFYWSIILTGGDIINLTSQNQTVKNMNIDNCSNFSNQILNITMVDEEDQFQLTNTTLEVAINLLSVDRTQTVVSLSGDFENQNPLGICINENITAGTEYSLDAVLKYTSTGYAIEYYNLVNSSLNNETTTQSITLYNLNASDSTDFQLTFTGEDFLPVENALVFIERQYIAENTFKTVELPKTDSNGQTILHLVRNDIVYNIRVIKNGVVLASFANIIAFCDDFTIGDCSLPLNAISNISLVFDYDDEIGLIYDETPQYNETTKITSFSFASTDGTTKVVNMKVERRDVFGNRTVCENTVVSSSGLISCQANQDITDTSLVFIISVDGEEKLLGSVIIDDTAYGQNGFAMFFIFAMATLLMFSGSKTWTLIGVSLNYIFGVSLGLIIGGIAGVGSTGIFILIITIVGIWQLNKERKQ